MRNLKIVKNPEFKELSNSEKLSHLWDELLVWMGNGNEQRDNLSYAVSNNYRLHAVSIWQDSGASALPYRAIINRRKEIREINSICNEATIYVCKNCNHHSFLEDDEGPEIDCESCLDVMDREVKEKKRKTK